MFVLGRTEHIADIVWQAGATQQLPTQGGNLPNDRFIYKLRFTWEGRITNNAGPNNPTARLHNDVYNLLEQITISGYHRVRGQREEFVNLRGSDLAEICRIYTRHDPLKTPASLDLTASATNDIRFILDLPFTPLLLPLSQQSQYLLDAPNYESLQMSIRMGDDRSVFSGGTAGAFSAYGSGSGNPRLRVHGLFAQAGNQRFAGFVPGRVFRSFQERTGADMTTSGGGTRLYNIPRGFRIRSIMMKTGVKATGTTTGNNAYASVNDAIFTNVRLYQGLGRAIRTWTDFYVIQEDIGMDYGIRPNPGFALVDFASHGNLMEALNTAGLIAGTTGDTDLYIGADVTGAANQAATFILEEIRYAPANVMRRSPRYAGANA